MSTIRLERLENPNTSNGGIDIDSSGNVGINTTTPGTKLEVGGAITSKTSTAGLSDQSITFSESGSGNGYGVRLGHVSNTEFAFERYDFGWAETVRVNGAGSVLVGTADGNFASGKGLKIADAGAARIKLCDTDTGVGSLDGMDISFAGVDGYIENRENGALIVATNNTERMRIDSSGNVGIGNTTPGSYNSYGLPLVVTNTGLNGGITIATSSSGTGNIHFADGTAGGSSFRGIIQYNHTNDSMSFHTAETLRMLIGSNGYIYANGVYNAPVGGTTRDVYVENNGNIGYLSSIKASKTNISDLTEIDWLWSLSPKTFNYRVKDEDGNYTDEANPETQYGLIAEEVEQVVPGICFYNVDEEGTQALAGVQYSKLITPLLKALQQANARIETLEAKVAALESTT